MFKRIYFEITNNCNLNCSFCTNKKNNSFVNIDDFKLVLKQIKQYCDYIYLHIIGEPTIHPDFKEFVEIINEYNVKLILVTNGLKLNQIKELLNYNCFYKLAVSIHSIDEVVIDGGYFNTIIGLMENNHNTIIDLRFLNVDKLKNNALLFYKYLIEKYQVIITNKKSYKLKNNVFLTILEEFKWPSINDEIIGDYGYCLGGKQMIAITSNLDVTLCCLDPQAHNKLGNLRNNTLEEILNSKKYIDYKENLAKNKLKFDLCKKCTYRNRFK